MASSTYKVCLVLTFFAAILPSSLARAQSRNEYYDRGTDSDYPSDAIPYFLEEPMNVTTRVGQRVVLGCRIGNGNSNMSVQWTKDSFGLGTKDLVPQYWKNMRILDTNPESKSTFFTIIISLK